MSASSKKSFYITTTLPYVNAEPHIGFATEILRADVLNRWKKIGGHDVFFNTGTDEHGLKIYQKAQEEDIDIRDFVNKYSDKFKGLIELLGIDKNVHFIRTTDEKHIKAAQEFWKRCQKDIEKKIYKTKYCIGCELEKTDSELENGQCVLHPNLEIEEREEENYFFKFSNYQEKLLDLYKSRPDFVIPDFRFNEIKSFVEKGLEDFSISRLKEKMPWGVPVPGDPKHIMYVWFDALVSYISTLGWPSDDENFNKFWVNGTPTQYAGKDNLRQQSAMWQAMLMSAEIPNSHQIIINGFINSSGQKMSKSLGNVISPSELVEKYGTEATRYLLLRHVHPWEDTGITWEKLDEWYNAHLANGLGNLVSRIMTLAAANLEKPAEIPEWENMEEYFALLEKYDFNAAMDYIWNKIGTLDLLIQDKKPWESKDKKVISDLAIRLYSIARMINPLMPETSAKIKALVKANKKPENLFPRLN